MSDSSRVFAAFSPFLGDFAKGQDGREKKGGFLKILEGFLGVSSIFYAILSRFFAEETEEGNALTPPPHLYVNVYIEFLTPLLRKRAHKHFVIPFETYFSLNFKCYSNIQIDSPVSEWSTYLFARLDGIDG